MAQKTLLIILDGWGKSKNRKVSAVDQANTPYIDFLYDEYEHSILRTDGKGIMNQSIKEIKGEIMVISQFTLMAQTKKGNRPSYGNAAKHGHAIPLYNLFKTVTQNGLSKPVISGKFGSNMEVEIINDGPVTICIDTKNRD